VGWQRRYFKGNKVWARVDEQGELVVEDGRVPMKYSESEDAKIYNANPRNLSGPLDDQGRPQRSSSKGEGTKRPPRQIQPSDPPQVSTDVPDEVASEPFPEDGVIEIYTDGACSGNPGPCGYGLLIRDGFTYRELRQYLGRGTNNIAELTAIKVALEQVEDKSRPVRLYTDSRYSIGVLMDGWKAKANRELILEMRELIAEFDDLEFIKVKGHAGHALNERADALATSTLDGHR
jgi:ribonuclease HI